MNTVFKSPGLILIGVSWSWAVALKLVRYQKEDPDDIAAILSLGTQLRGCRWTQQLLEGWLLNLCSPMGYSNYPPQEISKTRAKMQDAISRVASLPWHHSAATVSTSSLPPTLVPYQPSLQPRHPTSRDHPARPNTIHEGHFEHQERQRQRLTGGRARTQSLTGLSTKYPVPTAPPPPLPPLPKMLMSMPVPSVPPHPPTHTARSRLPSVSIPAAVPTASVRPPSSTISSQYPSRKTSVTYTRTAPKSAMHVVTQPSLPVMPTAVLYRLPHGFVPTNWHPYPLHAPTRIVA